MSFFSRHTFFGTHAADTLTGTDRRDVIFGFGGDDRIEALAGDDIVFAGFGDDVINGGAGHDRIFGGFGFDTATYAGGIADYEISTSGRFGKHATVRSVGDVEDAGKDRLHSVEALYFAGDDYTLFLDGTNNAVLAGDDSAATDEDSVLVIAAADLLANDREFDGDAIAIQSVDATSSAGAAISFLGGQISYDPTGLFDALQVGESATDTFSYVVDDGKGGTDTATVTVTIQGRNDAPVLTAFAAVTVDENTTAVAAGISATDVDSATLLFSLSGADAALFSLDATTGVLAFLTAPDFEAPGDADGDNQYEVTVTVDDGDGGSDSADITVTVADVLEVPPVNARINEFHYDNAGADTGEFVEVRTDAGDDVSALQVQLYNGSNGTQYNSVDVPTLTMTSDGTYDYYVWEVAGIQNGSPDGIALVNGGAVLEFLSYEGTFAATNGDASGLTSADIGQNEPSNTATGDSLQRGEDDNWDAPRAETKGAANDAGPVIVINEVLVSTTGADVEFLEIFGTPGTSLAGLSIVNIESDDASGNIDNRFDLPADAVIGDNGFYLLGNSLVPGALGVTPDAEIPTNFFENSSSTIALLQTGSITGTTVDGTEAVVDAVALADTSTGTFYYGAPVLGPDGSFYPSAAGRSPDGGDWALIDAFNPAGDNTTPTAGGGGSTGGEMKVISEIQGSGAASALVGQTVMVEAIVVGDFQDGAAGTNGDFNGFYLQEEDADADADAMTSEGIFVFDGSAPAVDVQSGDKVLVTGTVTEFFGETQLSNVTVTVVNSGNALPTAADIVFPVASTTTNSDGEIIADLEAYEGMLVTVGQELTVSDLFTFGRFGDMGLHADGLLETYTQANMPSVSGFQAFQDLAVRNTITLDDGSTIQNPATLPYEIAGVSGNIAGQFDAADPLGAGDTVSGLTGVLRYGRGSGGSGDEVYRLNPTVDPVFVDAEPRETSAPDVGGTITISAFNVLNFFTTLDEPGNTSGPNGLDPRGADTLEEFTRQSDKLIAALAEIGADVFGLIELENEYGDQNGDGQFAIGYIVDALNSAIPGAAYDYVDPGTPYGGGDAIMVGLIYDTNTVEIAAGTSAAILTDADLAGLGVDPGNPVFDGSGTSRAPLAATFTELSSDEDFTVSVNHFKSKGSVSPFGNNAGTGDGTGNNNEARLQAATALDAWLASNPTGSADSDVLILGDLNAYGMEDPVQYLLGQGYTDQVAANLPVDEFAFSFGFPVDLDTSPQVQSFGALDYALTSGSLSGQVTGAAEWHINALEASALDYNTNFKPQAQIDDLYAADPFRASDHDPLIIGLDLGAPDPLVVG